MAVDLHTHTMASDGTDTPAAVVAAAAAAGLTAVAVTDHDTTAGLEAARDAGRKAGVDVVSGVELSVDWPLGPMHILLYFVEPGDEVVEEVLARLRAGRHDRNHRILENLAAGGIEISYDEVLAVAGGEAVGRPHIARVLMTRGIVFSIQHAFDEMLGSAGWAYEPRLRVGTEQLAALTAAGRGLAVVAHPHTIGYGDNWEAVAAAVADLGVPGVEAIYGAYEPSERRRLAAAADTAGLVWTGGSDYHGANKPGIAVGTGRGDLEVPDECLDRLRDLHS